MTTILVPVINESPNTISVTFQSDYALSFASANPDGVPGNCQTGGPGIVGGPEYVNFLQRSNASAIPQNGYRSQSFQLAAYPNHTFYSFKDFTTGAKSLVAFLTTPVDTATVPTAAPAAATVTAAGGAAVGPLTATVPVVANALSYVWSGTAISSQTSVVTGASVNTLTYVGNVGVDVTLVCTITTESGQVVASSTKLVTLT